MNDPVVIVGAARTPMGAFQGDFSSKSANELGAVAIAAAVERSGVDPKLVEHAYMGNCLMAGQGQAPARQAAIKGGLPLSTGAVTLSKMCGAAMQVRMKSKLLACAALSSGFFEITTSWAPRRSASAFLSGEVVNSTT